MLSSNIVRAILIPRLTSDGISRPFPTNSFGKHNSADAHPAKQVVSARAAWVPDSKRAISFSVFLMLRLAMLRSGERRAEHATTLKKRFRSSTPGLGYV